MTVAALNDDSPACLSESNRGSPGHGSIPRACTAIPLTNDAIKGALTYNFPREIIGDSAELARTVFIIHIQEQQSARCALSIEAGLSKVRETREREGKRGEDFKPTRCVSAFMRIRIERPETRVHVCGIACGGKIKRRSSFSYTLSS